MRWSGRAYWHCSWVSESFLAKHAKVRLKNFKARQVRQTDNMISYIDIDIMEHSWPLGFCSRL